MQFIMQIIPKLNITLEIKTNKFHNYLRFLFPAIICDQRQSMTNLLYL